MPPGTAKKPKKEEEKENSEPTGRTRTRSASLHTPAVAQITHSRVTTRSQVRQDGTTEISEGLSASVKRGPTRASPMRNTKTPEIRNKFDNTTNRPEEEASEATDDLSTVLEVDESDFPTQETSNRTVPSQSRAPALDNGITTGLALKRSPKHKPVHSTNPVQGSANSGLAAGHVSGSGTVNIVITNPIPGPAPVPAVVPTQIASNVGFPDSVVNAVARRISELDNWTVRQYTKLAAHRCWKFFEYSLLGLFILLLLGPFYTHYQYQYTSGSLDIFTNHLLNASLQTRNMSRRLVSIEEQLAKLDAIMVTKEEVRANQAERRQINWLSQLVGAKVILDLTSSEIQANVTIKPSWWSQLWYGYKPRTGPGPDAALLPQKRDELNPTYCVQKKEGRVKLQLAVSLKRYITPTQLIIEHWPKSEVGSFHRLISAATAPKEIELWVYNERARTQKEVINALQLEVDDHFPNFWTNEASVEKKLRLAMHSLDEIDHADSWLMVGRWKYDVYSEHNVQKFLIPFDLSAYNVATKSVVIRVSSNWGSPYAICLLGARLHGIDRDESKEEEEVVVEESEIKEVEVVEESEIREEEEVVVEESEIKEEEEVVESKIEKEEVDGDEDEYESIFEDDLAG